MDDIRTAFDLGKQNPDATLFRTVFGEPRNAVGLLRSELPPEVAKQIDWGSLRRLDRSFVPAALAPWRADVWFEARIGALDGYLLLLLDRDHDGPSESPLRSVMRLFEWWLDDHGDAEHLPPVVPYVLHVGAVRDASR